MTEGTKNDLPRTGDEDEGRVTSETVVTDGPTGLLRLRQAMRRILAVRPDGAKDQKEPRRP